jgi:hypothetical protein
VTGVPMVMFTSALAPALSAIFVAVVRMRR